MGTTEIETLADAPAVAARGRDVFIDSVREACARRGVAYVALSGGSSPRALYRLLAADPIVVDWLKVHLFVSDDRLVPLTDESSNSGLAARELVAHVPLPRENWHPVVFHPEVQPSDIALSYESEICRLVPVGVSAPRFDLVFLGMGSDRHTASLFPGKPALQEETHLVVTTSPGVLPPPVDRITFTFPLINGAESVVLLAPGADKQEAFQQVRAQLREQPSHEHVPAARVRPEQGRVTWLVDEAAATAS